MQDDRARDASLPQIAVSPNNPCPFLRAVVAAGFVDGHVVPLAKLAQTVEAASGETGLKKKIVGLKTCLVALVANGLGPLRLLRSWWSGAVLDALARRSARQARRGLAHPRRDSRSQRGRTGAPRRIRQGPAGSCRRHRARADGRGNHRLHGREFRTRQGQPALDRPQADGGRMAGPAERHGQGRGRTTLPQRGRGQDAVSSSAGCPSGSTRA